MHSLQLFIRAAFRFATGVMRVRMRYIFRGESLRSEIKSWMHFRLGVNFAAFEDPMCADHFQTHHWADSNRDALTTRHTHEDALSEREFEILLEACERLSEAKSYEAQLICLLAGRLELRAGKITHFRKQWIDQDRDLIKIPQSESCVCGYCREQAKQAATNNADLTFTQAMADRWHPKTANSSRVIPFDVSLRVELRIDRFLDRYEEFPKSRSTINRRLSESATEAGLTGRVYPYCLRGTATSFHAYQGVPPGPLEAMMGERPFTAQKYIPISGAVTATAIRNVHH